MIRLGVLISGGGTNLQAIIDACNKGEISADLGLVISSDKEAYGLIRAERAGIDNFYIEDNGLILEKLKSYQVDLIVLAGYLRLVPQEIIDEYEDRILNIHPSLIPSFSGKGYYGMKVHQAAIDRGVKVSGATVHLVNKDYDAGKILKQEVVRVYEDDGAEDLAARVLKLEHKILVEAIEEIIQKEYL